MATPGDVASGGAGAVLAARLSMSTGVELSAWSAVGAPVRVVGVGGVGSDPVGPGDRPQDRLLLLVRLPLLLVLLLRC